MTKLRSELIAFTMLVQCAALAQVKGPDTKSLEASINAAFSRKDANALASHLASNYNEGGVSKSEAVRQLAALFRTGTVQVEYRILEFHQFPGKKIGYFKTSTQMSVGRPGSASKELRTAGYASAINEGGQWRIFATQPAACPRVNNLNVAGDRGDWVGWGSQLNPAGMAEAMLPQNERPVFAVNFAQAIDGLPGKLGFAQAGSNPKFDKADWERRFQTAWTSKNAQELLSFYGADYNEFGLDRTAVTNAVRGTLDRYDKIECKYRVLGIRYLPGTKLASLKAAIDLQGQPKGTTTMEPILQVAGYASLVAEGKAWKVYATQLFTTPQATVENLKAVTPKDWPPRMDATVSR